MIVCLIFVKGTTYLKSCSQSYRNCQRSFASIPTQGRHTKDLMFLLLCGAEFWLKVSWLFRLVDGHLAIVVIVLQASQLLSHAFFLAVAFGLALIVLMETFAPQLLALMGTGKDYLEPALIYLRVRALSGTTLTKSMCANCHVSHNCTLTCVLASVLLWTSTCFHVSGEFISAHTRNQR